MKITVVHRINNHLEVKLKENLKLYELQFANDLKEAEILARDSEVLIGMKIPYNVIISSEKLKLVHAITAGIDGIDLKAVIEKNAKLCNARGCYSIPVAEHTIALMLAWEARILEEINATRNRQWKSFLHGELYGKTLGIIGLGSIGIEIAKRAKALGMKVYAIKRDKTFNPIINIDFLGTFEDLDFVLENSDYIILALPLTGETYHLISEKEFHKMKKDAVLVNISRGAIIDEKSLIKALEEKRISAALLDVLEKEPPDNDNPLLTMQNILITPHTSGITVNSFIRVAELIRDNVERLVKGKPLINEVDLRKGY
jgi:Phosphoglycerate dehydrogenase and related dehydrogenases